MPLPFQSESESDDKYSFMRVLLVSLYVVAMATFGSSFADRTGVDFGLTSNFFLMIFDGMEVTSIGVDVLLL
jgi:hypothetical protein